MNRNYFAQGFYAVLLATLIVSAYPFVHEYVPLLRDNLRTYDTWLTDIASLSPGLSESSNSRDTIVADSALPTLSLRADAHVDSAAIARIEQMTPQDVRAYTGREFLEKFYTALRQVREKSAKARIAYYGDSMIEGDLITQSIRDALQKQFGGVGVGYVPITSATNNFRQTIGHAFSPGWKTFSYVNPRKQQPYGINGEYFLAPAPQKDAKPDAPIESTWVAYKATRAYTGTSALARPSIFYGKALSSMYPDTTKKKDSLPPIAPPASSNYIVVKRGAKSDTIALTGKNILNEIKLADSPLKEVRIDFHISPELPVFGANFEGGSGVYVDNFSSRGNSGLTLSTLRPDMLHAYQTRFDYSLIVLQFGLNLVDSTRTNYLTYQRGMVRVINHLKANFPNAAILVIGVSDKAAKIDGRLRTDPCVSYILTAQRNAAIETGTAFLNLYDAMGGYNSIVRWADGKPALANKDYTHPNHLGAKKLADLILAYLLADWKE